MYTYTPLTITCIKSNVGRDKPVQYNIIIRRHIIIVIIVYSSDDDDDVGGIIAILILFCTESRIRIRCASKPSVHRRRSRRRRYFEFYQNTHFVPAIHIVHFQLFATIVLLLLLLITAVVRSLVVVYIICRRRHRRRSWSLRG